MDEVEAIRDSMSPAELTALTNSTPGSSWSTQTLTGEEGTTQKSSITGTSEKDASEIRRTLSEIFQPLQAGYVRSSIY